MTTAITFGLVVLAAVVIAVCAPVLIGAWIARKRRRDE